MTYGDTTRARETAGNPSTTTVSALFVTQAVAYGDSMVNTFTGKSDWTSSDVEYASVQTASELFASAFIRKRFGTDEQKSKQDKEDAMAICESIRRARPVGRAQNYRTYPINSDATPYRSIRGPISDTDDSDLS